jgi:hypothetical protein
LIDSQQRAGRAHLRRSDHASFSDDVQNIKYNLINHYIVLQYIYIDALSMGTQASLNAPIPANEGADVRTRRLSREPMAVDALSPVLSRFTA